MLKGRIIAITSILLLLLVAGARAEERIVTKTADTRDGACNEDCSLREALAAAQPGDVITFAESALGTHQLTLGALTIQKENITINGGEEHKVIIRGNGVLDPKTDVMSRETVNCFRVDTSNNTIKGLVLQNCSSGIFLYGKTKDVGGGKIECLPVKGNKIENNYIGTDEKGEAAVPNQYGVYFWSAQENIVGPKNVISGNSHYGMIFSIACTSLNQVEGNILGLNATGETPLMNKRYGIVVQSFAKANTIGGETEEKRNIISGNNWGGIIITAGGEHNIIEGNYIGTDITGKKMAGNGYGIYINHGSGAIYKTNDNVIRGNVISGQNHGVVIRGKDGTFEGSENNRIEKNIIGLAADLSPLTGLQGDVGNVQDGVYIFSHNNIIGGDTPEDANIIAMNGRIGITVQPNIHGNQFKINSIYGNARAGTLFSNNTVHNGIAKPNGFKAEGVPAFGDPIPPEMDKLYLSGDNAKASAKVDIYEADDATKCQGKTYIGSATADENGQWQLLLTDRLNDPGTTVVALQTDVTDGSSEFSNCFEIPNIAPEIPQPEPRGVQEKQKLEFQLLATDSNGDKLQFACTSNCLEGMTVNAETGEVSWTPSFEAGGQTYEVGFQITDGTANKEVTISIIVEDLDTAPVLADLENQKVAETEDLQFQLSATDEDGDTPSYAVGEGLREGMEINEETGAFSWTTKREDIGKHQVALRAKDNDKEHLFAEKIIEIEVEQKYFPPELEAMEDKTVSAGESVALAARVKEKSEGLEYTYIWSASSGQGTLSEANAEETEYQAPEVEEDLDEEVSVEVADSLGQSIVGKVKILVLAKQVAAPPTPQKKAVVEEASEEEEGSEEEVAAYSWDEYGTETSDLALSGGESWIDEASGEEVVGQEESAGGTFSCNLQPGLSQQWELPWVIFLFAIFFFFLRFTFLGATGGIQRNKIAQVINPS